MRGLRSAPQRYANIGSNRLSLPSSFKGYRRVVRPRYRSAHAARAPKSLAVPNIQRDPIRGSRADNQRARNAALPTDKCRRSIFALAQTHTKAMRASRRTQQLTVDAIHPQVNRTKSRVAIVDSTQAQLRGRWSSHATRRSQFGFVHTEFRLAGSGKLVNTAWYGREYQHWKHFHYSIKSHNSQISNFAARKQTGDENRRDQRKSGAPAQVTRWTRITRLAKRLACASLVTTNATKSLRA